MVERWAKSVYGGCLFRPLYRARPAVPEARKRLAVLAIADETKAGARRNFVCDAAHVAAPAAKREILRVQSYTTHRFDSQDLGTLQPNGLGDYEVSPHVKRVSSTDRPRARAGRELAVKRSAAKHCNRSRWSNVYYKGQITFTTPLGDPSPPDVAGLRAFHSCEDRRLS